MTDPTPPRDRPGSNDRPVTGNHPELEVENERQQDPIPPPPEDALLSRLLIPALIVLVIIVVLVILYLV